MSPGGPEVAKNRTGRLVRAVAQDAAKRAVPGGQTSLAVCSIARIIAVHVWGHDTPT
jgi:hypothetical protein